ncbi:hypothetical protein DQ400_19730, partial [Vreelandella sulfidaeris]
EGAATGAELYVGHGTVWVNGDNGYIAMQVSGLARMLHRVGQQHPNARFGGDDAAQSWKLAIY